MEPSVGRAIGGCLGAILTVTLFTLLPAWLLFAEHGLSIAVSYSSISMTLLAIFWNSQENKK